MLKGGYSNANQKSNPQPTKTETITKEPAKKDQAGHDERAGVLNLAARRKETVLRSMS